MTAEAVDYPAVPVPDDDGGVGAWLGFMGSVDAGAAGAGQAVRAFVAQCPTSKVVLAGYSQGAMVVHRNLQALAASPNLAAVLLVADGDRRPDDPTLQLGHGQWHPEARQGCRAGLADPGSRACCRWLRQTSAPTPSACAISTMPSATTTPTPTTPRRRTRARRHPHELWRQPDAGTGAGRRRCTSSSGRRRRHLRDRCQGRTPARSPAPPHLRAAIALPAPRRWRRSHPPPTIPRAEASPTPFLTPQHRHRRV